MVDSYKNEIERLAVNLSISMDKIVLLDKMIISCPDEKTRNSYIQKFEKEMDKYFVVKEQLLGVLVKYMSYEADNKIPINMSYRLLYKTLRQVG